MQYAVCIQIAVQLILTCPQHDPRMLKAIKTGLVLPLYSFSPSPEYAAAVGIGNVDCRHKADLMLHLYAGHTRVSRGPEEFCREYGRL